MLYIYIFYFKKVEMREQEANDFKNEGDRVKKEIFKLKQEFSQLRDYCRKLEGERKDFFQRIQSQFNPPSSPPTVFTNKYFKS